MNCNDPTFTELEGICYKVHDEARVNFEAARLSQSDERIYYMASQFSSQFPNCSRTCSDDGSRLYEPRDVTSHLALTDKLGSEDGDDGGGRVELYWMGAKMKSGR